MLTLTQTINRKKDASACSRDIHYYSVNGVEVAQVSVYKRGFRRVSILGLGPLDGFYQQGLNNLEAALAVLSGKVS